MSFSQSVLMPAENKAGNFKSKRLESADYCVVGTTTGFIGESKRYNNYKRIFLDANIIVSELLYRNNSITIEENTEKNIYAMLNERISKAKKLEEWGFCYSQISFESIREKIESEVAQLFSGIDEVIAMHSSQYDKSALHFQILTDNEKYDRTLMMKMLELEYNIGHNYKDVALSFDYIPKVYEYEKDIVVEGARSIYKKNMGLDNEFIAGSFTASSPQQATSEFVIPIPSAF